MTDKGENGRRVLEVDDAYVWYGYTDVDGRVYVDDGYVVVEYSLPGEFSTKEELVDCLRRVGYDDVRFAEDFRFYGGDSTDESTDETGEGDDEAMVKARMGEQELRAMLKSLLFAMDRHLLGIIGDFEAVALFEEDDEYKAWAERLANELRRFREWIAIRTATLDVKGDAP